MISSAKNCVSLATFFFICCLITIRTTAAEKDHQILRRAAWTTSRLKGTPTPPSPFRIVSAFPGVRFDKPTSLIEIPGANRILVTQMNGKIFSFQKTANVDQADLVVDLVKLLPRKLASQGVSLFHATVHPKFKQNRAIFVCYVHPDKKRHTRVSRFTFAKSDGPPRIDPNSEQVIITWPAGGHNGGCLEFGTDGFLYISTGDGSGPNPPDGRTTGQDVSDLLGAMLRINVDKKSGHKNYAIPTDNPFISLKGARKEIWAYGLRNPWKFGIDSHTDAIFAADNGWETWELIHRIERGGNCGWPVMEGRAVLRPEVKIGPTPIVPPIKDHLHTEANSVIGGPVYRGKKLPTLNGSFVYGGYITGTIWAVKPEPDGTYSSSTLVDTDQRIVGFAQGSRGELFVLDYDFTGQIFELLPSGLKDTSADFPRRLSQTGLFASLDNLKPAAGVVPYFVRATRWMDGAKAQRWIAIPGKGVIKLAAGPNRKSVFPNGTVMVKQLSLPTKSDGKPIRLETQILHFENGQWNPYSYVWDDSNQEAYLADSLGSNRALQIPNSSAKSGFSERTWHVCAQNECRLCHNAGSHFVLGFELNQLNRSYTKSTFSDSNQLAILAIRGVVDSAISIANDDPGRLVDPVDTSQNLNDRARSYLHANCSMCHHRGGNAIVSFYLRREMPLVKLNTNKGTGIGTFGMRNAKIIVPGDPFRSVLMYRMSKLGYARMPYIGSQAIDSAGVALISDWIRSLPSDGDDNASQPITAGSSDSKSLQLLARKTSGNRARRDGAIGDLVKSTEGSLALLSRMHAGSLNPNDAQSAAAKGYKSSNSNIRGLFEHFIPESQRRATLGPNINPQTILSQSGNSARGKLIFFSDAARCRACHDINDASKSTGPTIAEIVKKYPRRAELLQHVLQPSLKIDEKFATYAVILDDGQTVTGIKVTENPDEIVLKTAEKKTVRIARKQIDEIRTTKQSLMPDRILSDLTAQEAADLLAYIRSLRGKGTSSKEK